MTSLERCYRLLDSGYSLITVGNNKMPNYSWKQCQTIPLSKDKFKLQYDYKGGIIKKDGTEMQATNGVGIVTGYDNLEVIDIDLKVFTSLEEQNNFWNELLSFIKANIDDFELKFVIYKTKNQGYHILYKCDTVAGNTKIAKLKGMKEAVIESRGIGGYVFIYDNQISDLSYIDIQTITAKDRDILWSICKTYNYVEEEIQPEKTHHVEYKEADIKPWDDYNKKVSIFDIVGEDFKIIRTISDKYIIKRHGGDSAHSGYVYRNSGCMYLFTTATIYPHEQLITPFKAFAYKYHKGDFKQAGAEAYRLGYGTRVVPKPKEIKEKIKIESNDLIFPIDIFPLHIQNYIIECNKTLDSSIDYMGCSMMWLLSVIIGNSMVMKVKNGWKEVANIWIAVVGQAGIGKSPSIQNILSPLQDINSREIKEYIKKSEKYKVFSDMTAKEKENHEEVKKPKNTQFIANDITLEALVQMHEENPNAVGVFKDELNGWFKDMNKYRAGSDLEFWLSTWSGKSVSLNRKTATSSFVDKPLIPVHGGIQPGILNIFYTEENKDNGFIDRMLLSYPDMIIEKYNDNEMDYQTIQWYNDLIVNFYQYVKNNLVSYNEFEDIQPNVCVFLPDARIEWKRIFNEITDIQNSDEENEYMKSMLPKQKSYIPRFAMLINAFNLYVEGCRDHKLFEVTKESILKAEKLSKYFIAMAKKIKVNSIERNELKETITLNKTKTNFEKFIEMYRVNPEMNKKEAGELLGVSRQQIYRWVDEISKKV